ncbi:C3H1-type domain-containing protein [Mycena sanguinolenta]|uniref:C3H1-type domain-containing protein n=1 Tax=Mycena sanguinolenta TaxID=230812 RepID=A0A8H6YT50_9AGAR|nr:C3H1-type domain-containing protein [Mycena sanguinolenta]
MAVQFTRRVTRGDSCRFVHPNDANWPGLKPFVDTRLLKQSGSVTKRNKEAGKSASSESRGPALVSQADLFLRCKIEADDQSLRMDRGRALQTEGDRDRDAQRDRDKHRGHDRRDHAGNNDRSHKTYSRNRSMSPTRPYTKKYSRNGSDSSKKSEHEPNRSKQGPAKNGGDLTTNDLKRRGEASSVMKPKGSVDSKDDFSSSSAQTLSRWTAPSSADTVLKTQVASSDEMTLPLQLSDETKRTERLVGLFRSLARLSNQVVQDTAAQEREGQKLQTYTEISSALSKISASAATSVAPTLADIMLKHEQSKHRVEESFKALGGVWEQVFDVFVTEVAHVIDSGLQNAITVLKKETNAAIKEIAECAAGPLKNNTGESMIPYDRKRARTRGPTEKENEESRPGRGASRDRDHKRRRFASRSSSPDPHDRRGSKHNGDASIEDILTQMKMKIDQQAASLHSLQKENNEVWITERSQGLRY